MIGSQSAKPIRDSGSGCSKSPNVRVQSNPVSPHELKAWQSGGVHVRVFKLDLESCEGCGGQVRVIACLDDPVVIAKILAHLDRHSPSAVSTVPPLPARGPPRQGVLELS